jgi:hypothetical protein
MPSTELWLLLVYTNLPLRLVLMLLLLPLLPLLLPVLPLLPPPLLLCAPSDASEVLTGCCVLLSWSMSSSEGVLDC